MAAKILSALMIYLASPYSHADPAVMEERFDAACRAAGSLIASGLVVYSPIAHTHPIAVRVDLPRAWDFWQKFDTTIIGRCSALVVLMLPGWNESRGVAAEIAIAVSLGLPISCLEP